jgi:hypothetical protein
MFVGDKLEVGLKLFQSQLSSFLAVSTRESIKFDDSSSKISS